MSGLFSMGNYATGQDSHAEGVGSVAVGKADVESPPTKNGFYDFVVLVKFDKDLEQKLIKLFKFVPLFKTAGGNEVRRKTRLVGKEKFVDCKEERYIDEKDVFMTCPETVAEFYELLYTPLGKCWCWVET